MMALVVVTTDWDILLATRVTTHIGMLDVCQWSYMPNSATKYELQFSNVCVSLISN